MNTTNNQEGKPQRQTAENPSGDAVINQSDDKQQVEKSDEESGQALDNEQQFKEAQTERD